MQRNFFILTFVFFLCTSSFAQMQTMGRLRVSPNGRYFIKENGDPFFWLGDTGWLLFGKLTREDAVKYLEDRRKKGFNVIQVMLLHTTGVINAYGDTALKNRDVASPNITPGSSFSNPAQYDFWDHVDYIIDQAAAKGLYMALVPVWGTNVGEGHVNQQQAKIYAAWLANRYKNKPNIIWLNGGDIKGSDSLEVWQTIGNTLRDNDPNHLITYHPRGRAQSSMWFHNERWLDFNMFQSGHRRYDQDTSANEQLHYGEDNWRYIQVDYSKTPAKPTLDGEPSYENIPQGLHDTAELRWKDRDVRRYGYWSVFAGGAGYTYGDNAVMQMRKSGEKGGAFGAKDYWFDAINDPGSSQMIYLEKLMLSRPYFEREPGETLVANQGTKYNYIAATRGKGYAFFYTYNGRNIKANMGVITGAKVKASWYDPRNGSKRLIGIFSNKGVHEFDPPGKPQEGNDWVLVLDGQ